MARTYNERLELSDETPRPRTGRAPEARAQFP
jgi:hypothetical protein